VVISWAQNHHWHWFFGQRERSEHPFRPADWFPPAEAYAHSED
jgi:hypothetical protein